MMSGGVDYVGTLLEEVALEGLDGITLGSLWVRLLTRDDFNMDDFLKPFLWKCACHQSDFEFYELPQPRPTLQYVSEISDSDDGVSRNSIQIEEDIYPIDIINDNEIHGSCATYKTRKLISSEIRDDKHNMKCSLVDAMDRWGDKMVIVASQYLRLKFLVSSNCDPNMKIADVKYAILERIGRCRYLGATSVKEDNASVGYRSITAILISPKRIYYDVKYLVKYHLVTKQRYDMNIGKRNTIGRLLHLSRFYSQYRCNTQINVNLIMEYLEKKPGQQEEMVIVRQDLKFDAHELNNVAKRDPANLAILEVLCKDLYPDNPEKHYLHRTMVTERKTRVLKMLKPRKHNDESSDDSSDEEAEDIEEVDLVYERPVLHQLYHLIVDSGSMGLTQSQIRSLLGLDRVMARSICRSLLRTGLVEDILQDRGRQRSIQYRERKKNDPVFLQKEKSRKKLAYLQRTPKQIDADKVQNRMRQQRYRDHMKNRGLSLKTEKKKILTRCEKEKLRTYWKEKQREHRLKMTAQKLRRKREKDRAYYESNKPNTKPTSGPSIVNAESQPWTDAAQRKAISRIKRCIPTNAEKFAISIASIVKKVTPRKRVALQNRGINCTPQAKKKIEFEKETESLVKKVIQTNLKMKKQFIKEMSYLKRKRLVRKASTYFGIREASVSSFSGDFKRKTRSDAVGEDVSRAIGEFFGRPGVSTNLPLTKRIKKDQQERKVLDRTYKDLYKEFTEEARDANLPGLSLSTFVRNKPANVESTNKRSWYGCLCEVCTNVDLKIRALLNLAQRHKSDIRLKDKYEAINKTLCEKGSSKFNRKICIQRNCSFCGSDRLVQFFAPLLLDSKDDIVVYTRWERKKKIYRGKEVAQIMPVSNKKTPTAVVCELSNEIETLAEHLFVAAWQQNQFTRLIKDVPKSWVVLNMDFSENYSCIQQQEVQSAHWSHNQVTIHPTVAYYKCPKKDCNQTVQEALIFVSDDLQHDASAVMKFVSIANDHLMQKRGLAIQREIHLTDGCSAQYKSKTPFSDISYSNEDFGFPTERHFYGSRHGKGPSDGAGAVIKSSVRRAVMGQNIVINSAQDLYTFAKHKLEIDGDHLHSMRTTFLVDAERIEHDRPQRTNVKTLAGTRKLHCIKTVSPLKVESRNLSCFCVGCTDASATSHCENSEHIESWVAHQLTSTLHGEQAQSVRARGVHRCTRGAQRDMTVATRRGTQRATGQAQRGKRGATRGTRGAVRGNRRTKTAGQSHEETSSESDSEDLENQYLDLSDDDDMSTNSDHVGVVHQLKVTCHGEQAQSVRARGVHRCTRGAQRDITVATRRGTQRATGQAQRGKRGATRGTRGAVRGNQRTKTAGQSHEETSSESDSEDLENQYLDLSDDDDMSTNSDHVGVVHQLKVTCHGDQTHYGRVRGARRGTRGSQRGTRGVIRGTRGSQRGTRGAKQETREAQRATQQFQRTMRCTRGTRGATRGIQRKKKARPEDTSSESESEDLDLAESEDQHPDLSGGDDVSTNLDSVGVQETSFTSDRDALEVLNIEIPLIFDNEADEACSVDVTDAIMTFINSSDDLALSAHGLCEDWEPPPAQSQTLDDEIPFHFVHGLNESQEPLAGHKIQSLSKHGLTEALGEPSTAIKPPTLDGEIPASSTLGFTSSSRDDVIPTLSTRGIIEPLIATTSSSRDDVIPTLSTRSIIEPLIATTSPSQDDVIPTLSTRGIIEPLIATTSPSQDDVIPTLSTRGIIEPLIATTSTSQDDVIPTLSTRSIIEPLIATTSPSQDDVIPTLSTRGIIEPLIATTSTSQNDVIPTLSTRGIIEPQIATTSSQDDVIPTLSTRGIIEPLIATTSTSQNDVIPTLSTRGIIEPQIATTSTSQDDVIPTLSTRGIIEPQIATTSTSQDDVIPTLSTRSIIEPLIATTSSRDDVIPTLSTRGIIEPQITTTSTSQDDVIPTLSTRGIIEPQITTTSSQDDVIPTFFTRSTIEPQIATTSSQDDEITALSSRGFAGDQIQCLSSHGLTEALGEPPTATKPSTLDGEINLCSFSTHVKTDAPSFISKKHSHLSKLHNTMQSEREKFTGLLQSTSKPVKIEIPEEMPDNSAPEVSKMETDSGSIAGIQLIDSGETTIRPADVSLVEDKIDNTFMTARILKRSRWIIEKIREAKVVESMVPFIRLIRQREKEDKDLNTIDKRSVVRLLSKLANSGQIRCLTRTISARERVTEIRLYCDADVGDDDVLIQSAINQAKLKHFSCSRQDTFEKTKLDCHQAVLPSSFSDSLKTSVTHMMEFRSKLKSSQMNFDPASATKFGYLPRYRRAKLLHELLWYLVYVYGETPESDHHLAPIFIPRQAADSQDCSDTWWKDLAEPPVCLDEDSWKRYIHRIPRHTGYKKGWCLLSDILMVLPISVFCKLVKLPFKIFGLSELLGDSKKCLYPITYLPWKIAEQILFGRRYVFAVYDVCTLLCKMGLLSFGPQIMKDKEQVFVYLHRNVALLDTRSALLGYKVCVPPDGAVFDRLHYYFTDQSAIDQYWLDLKTFALNTNLGRRKLSNGNEDLQRVAINPEVSAPSAIRHLAADKVEDSGIVPGDGQGAAGLDSLLFSHLERHWIDVIGNKKPPKRMSSTDIVVPMKSLKSSKRAPGLNKTAFTTKIQFRKDKKPEVVKVTLKKGKGNIGGKGIKRKAAPLIVPKISEKKPKVKPHTFSKRPKRITGRLYDDTDVSARNRMMMERVSWTIEEDTLLLLSKVANLILHEHSRGMIIAWNIIRDLLHDHFPQKSLDKTSPSCQRRVAYVMRNPQTVLNVFVFLEESKQDKDLMSQFQGKVNFKTTEDDARIIFNELLSKLKDKFMTVKCSKKSDFNLEEFHSNYCITPASQRYKALLHDDVGKTADIYISTLHNVVHSYLSLTDKQGRQYEMFRLFNQYPEFLLQNVFIKMRENRLITRTKKTKKPHVYSVNFHQLSQRYSNLFKTRFPADLCVDTYKFVQNVMNPALEAGFRVDVQTVQHIGYCMAINALYSFEKLHVEAIVPHPIIGLDCKGLLNQVGRGKRVVPPTANPTASDKDREALMQELKAKMSKSDFKGDKSHSETESQTRRHSTENLIVNKEGKNVEQSIETEASDQESYLKGDNHQTNMMLDDDDNIAQEETSSDKETVNPHPATVRTVNPHPATVRTVNTTMEFVSKPRQTLSITEPYHGSSTILSRLLSSIIEPTVPARVNIRNLNPQDHFVVNACSFYMSIKSPDDTLILPKDETFWWDEPEECVILNPDIVNRVIKKQQTLIPFHLDIDTVWSEMESHGVEYIPLARNIYNHVEAGKEFGILSVKLQKKFCDDPNYLKCMNHLEEQQAAPNSHDSKSSETTQDSLPLSPCFRRRSESESNVSNVIVDSKQTLHTNNSYG